jgi:acetyl esterase/lipase
MIHYAPDDLLTLLKENSPDPSLGIPALRQSFSDLYAGMQQETLSACDYRIDTVPLRDGARGHWITLPGVLQDRVVLFFHGGGFTLGSTADHLGLCVRLAKAAEALVFSVDYRLAPEHPFPAAIQDAVAAYRYLISRGYQPHRILPAGISAGGSLVLGMLLSLRDERVPLPAGSICMSPAVDLLFPGQSVEKNASRDWITAERLRSIRQLYLGGRDPSLPLASPTHARLAGLPRLYIQAGTHELLLSDIGTFVDKARWAGVPVKAELWEGMFHCWQVFSDHLYEGEEAVGQAGAFARNILDR